MHLHQWTNDTSVSQQIRAYYNSGDYNDIEESYIIFELRDGFELEITDSGNTIIPIVLYNIFSTWKDNDCEIMFICGTDESRFMYRRSFLDFVDIHINTDILDIFIESVLHQAYNDCGKTMQIQNCTFLLDMNFSTGIELGYQNSWFFYEYFIPFIRSAYENEIRNQGQSNGDVLTQNNIKILCHLGGSTFFDAVYGQQISSTNYEYLYNNYVENDHIYAIGSSQSGEVYLRNFTNIVDSLRSVDNMAFPIFIYNPHGYDVSDVTYRYTAGQGTGMIPTIIEDFLNDEDLSEYDNYVGRCEITYKDLPTGEDGWIVSLSNEEGDFFVAGWQKFMTEDDKDFYFNYPNEWATI